MYTRISVTSERSNGQQVLKDHLTAGDKKILLLMLNQGMDSGRVRKKNYFIKKTTDSAAEITIIEMSYSIVLSKNEAVKSTCTIKYA
jgi:hypothetical protein